MTGGPTSLTLGWLGRHTPPGAGVDGRRAAVIDIAQDLLLRALHQAGRLDTLVFKGGTSLRKLYAGNQVDSPLILTSVSPTRPLIRRLAVLKIWVDAHGVTSATCAGRPGHGSSAFDPEVWLRTRTPSEVDLDDIGALAVPTPSLDSLNATIGDHFAFLRDLDDDEQRLASARGQDRPIALRLLAELPGSRLAELGIY